jgi:hypoxanthine phosphoribosyltransferase
MTAAPQPTPDPTLASMPPGSPEAEGTAGPGGRDFAHASEAEMARILDFYAVRWEYEPRTFPILWNLDGAVVESFAPDFYLPDLDLYLEMTTLRQKLVRKKNRKLRRLRELYPDIRIKLFYARDFRALLLKYGKLALVDEMSGTPGQVGLPREVVALAEPLGDAGPAAAAVPGASPAPAAPIAPAAPAGVPQTEPVQGRSRPRRRRASAAPEAAQAAPAPRLAPRRERGTANR